MQFLLLGIFAGVFAAMLFIPDNFPGESMFRKLRSECNAAIIIITVLVILKLSKYSFLVGNCMLWLVCIGALVGFLISTWLIEKATKRCRSVKTSIE